MSKAASDRKQFRRDRNADRVMLAESAVTRVSARMDIFVFISADRFVSLIIRLLSRRSSRLCFTSEQRLIFSYWESDTCFLEFLEIVQRAWLKARPSWSWVFFQIERFAFSNWLIEQITVSEIALDHHCLIRESSSLRDAASTHEASIEELIPTER